MVIRGHHGLMPPPTYHHQEQDDLFLQTLFKYERNQFIDVIFYLKWHRHAESHGESPRGHDTLYQEHGDHFLQTFNQIGHRVALGVLDQN
jgi:hypothetical protein